MGTKKREKTVTKRTSMHAYIPLKVLEFGEEMEKNTEKKFCVVYLNLKCCTFKTTLLFQQSDINLK